GVMAELFSISDVRVEQKKVTLPDGKVVEGPVVTFEVRAKSDLNLGVIGATCYDRDGHKYESGVVVFEPRYGEWPSGRKARATVVLPADPSRVKRIEFFQW